MSLLLHNLGFQRNHESTRVQYVYKNTKVLFYFDSTPHNPKLDFLYVKNTKTGRTQIIEIDESLEAFEAIVGTYTAYEDVCEGFEAFYDERMT